MEKFIFLDIDGVLNSFSCCPEDSSQKEGFNEISDYHLQKLAEIYLKCDAKIVLASTWRTLDSDSTTRPMYEYLVVKLAQHDMKIYDKTPIMHMNRPAEIVEWITGHHTKDMRFVILDDDFPYEAYAAYGLAKNLVQTQFFSINGGLQERHVAKAIQILNE